MLIGRDHTWTEGITRPADTSPYGMMSPWQQSEGCMAPSLNINDNSLKLGLFIGNTLAKPVLGYTLPLKLCSFSQVVFYLEFDSGKVHRTYFCR